MTDFVESTEAYLLVEPDEGFARLVVAHFDERGVLVEWVRDGRTALTRARAIRPRVVITSLDLDGIDGFELIERLSHSVPSATVVACATQPRARNWTEAELRQVGIARLVVRPMHLDDLVHAVNEALQVEKETSR